MLKKTLRALREYPWVILFALFILSYTVLDMSFTNKSYSELENRPLKTRPKMSFSALMSGDYDEKFDAYINDQFFGRDGWITLKSTRNLPPSKSRIRPPSSIRNRRL